MALSTADSDVAGAEVELSGLALGSGFAGCSVVAVAEGSLLGSFVSASSEPAACAGAVSASPSNRKPPTPPTAKMVAATTMNAILLPLLGDELRRAAMGIPATEALLWLSPSSGLAAPGCDG